MDKKIIVCGGTVVVELRQMNSYYCYSITHNLRKLVRHISSVNVPSFAGDRITTSLVTVSSIMTTKFAMIPI